MDESRPIGLFAVEVNQPQARARRSDPSSSHQAAREIESSGKASDQRRCIGEQVVLHPGCTAGELAEHAGLTRDQISRRTVELERKGIIHRGEQRQCEVHGKSMMTWWPGAGANICRKVSATELVAKLASEDPDAAKRASTLLKRLEREGAA